MSSELPNKDKNTIETEEPIIQNICFDDESGRLILSDSNNNHYLCDLFGRKKKKFKPNVTGRASYLERKKLFPLSLKNSEIQKELDRTTKYVDYFPSTRKFEGYSKFPRPIAPPFCNIPDYEMRELKKRELIEHLVKYFSDDIAKKKYFKKK